MHSINKWLVSSRPTVQNNQTVATALATHAACMPSDGGLSLNDGHLPYHQNTHRRRWVMCFFLGVILAHLLAACHGKDASIPVGIVGYNHTDSKIAQFLVNGGNGDTSIDSHRGGGSTACCAMVPNHWRPGLKVNIRWKNDLKSYKEQVVPIPGYDEVGDLAVHFLRNGEIKVFVTNVRLGHPDYPLTGPEAGLTEGEDPIRDEWRTNKKGARE